MRPSRASLSLLAFLALSTTTARGQAPVQAVERYDLAADQRERIELAKRELGSRTRTQIVDGVFVVVGDTSGTALMESALVAYFNGRFDRRPQEAVSVYLFASTERYQAYCRDHLGMSRCASDYGAYYPHLRRIVMNSGLGLGTLTHELVHPIIETDFPNAPSWLNEGIASLYEAPVIPRPGQIHGRKNWRYPRLLSALGDKQKQALVSSERLFLTLIEFREFHGEHEALNYAFARYFCQWLDAQNKLWPFYRTWRDNYASDRGGLKAFAEVTGLDFDEADAKFRRWLRSLK
jgi:hypothetical protein